MNITIKLGGIIKEDTGERFWSCAREREEIVYSETETQVQLELEYDGTVSIRIGEWDAPVVWIKRDELMSALRAMEQ